MDVVLTGREDRLAPWKFAVCGMAGTGKTLFASTAPSPLFVFFQENPRLKSVADRAIPHVKLVNDVGGLAAHEKLHGVLEHLRQAHSYETLVVDTGDELFQLMKDARRTRNGGEWRGDDWNWLADTFRELMLALVDLPLSVIVLFHTKTKSDEDEGTVKELMLQGQSRDEAPSWFDIVAALDTYEVVGDDGDTVTKRVLLTHSSRLYPWVKDHSGVLPRRFELSPGITNDFGRVMELVLSSPGVGDREVIDVIPEDPAEVSVGDSVEVPSPDDLAAKKGEKRQAAETEEIEEESVEEPVEAVEEAVEEDVAGVAEDAEGAVDEALALLGAIPVDEDVDEVDEVARCVVCGEEVEPSMQEVSEIRFRKILCKAHYKEENAKKRG